MKKMINGSEKQIKWAEEIRNNILGGLNFLKGKGYDVENTIKKLEGANSAKGWIKISEGNRMGEILPTITHTKGGGETTEDITDFYYHSSRDIYFPRIGNIGQIVKYEQIIRIEEKEE